jgi:predicted outer membrane repeat protein
MNKKYLLSLILVSLFLIGSVNAVSAFEFNSKQMSKDFSFTNPLSALFSVDVSGNFSNLDDAIKSGDGNILLTGDVLLSDVEKDAASGGIVIDHNIVIDGRGHKIDARKLAKIFLITGGSVTIKNTNLINGHAPIINNGGAIELKNGSLNVINSNFNNNEAIKSGGAIYTDSSTVSVTDSNFTNNTANQTDGGAIYSNSGNVSVAGNSIFTNNTAPNYGGAIYTVSGSVSVTGSNLNNNTAGVEGGAISSSNVNVINSNFTDNQVTASNSIGYGGAISSGTVNVVGSNFNTNTISSYDSPNWEYVKDSEGGAIYGSIVNVNGSNFNSNEAISNFIDYGDLSAGGAIAIKNGGNVNINGSTFNNNSAKWGGAIGSYGNMVVTSNSIFNNNEANYHSAGGAIWSINAVVNVNGSDFNNNKADEGEGGAIATGNNVNVSGNSIFNNNTAKNGGGAIIVYEFSGHYSVTCEYNPFKNATVVFKDNTPNDVVFRDSTLNDNKFINWVGNGNLSFGSLANAIKSSNEVNLTGDVAVYDPEVNVFKDGIVIDHDLVLDGQGHTIDARGLARIFQITAGSVTIKNVKLVNGYIDEYYGGSAILLQRWANINVSNSNFNNNSKTAVLIKSNTWADFDYCNFTSNNDGAIVFCNFVYGSVTNSNFNNNAADKCGGAISTNAFGLTVDSCNFTGNSVRNPQYGGGAIAAFNYDNVHLNLKNSIFKDNTASQGGALYIQKNIDFVNENNKYLPPVSKGHNDIVTNM